MFIDGFKIKGSRQICIKCVHTIVKNSQSHWMRNSTKFFFEGAWMQTSGNSWGNRTSPITRAWRTIISKGYSNCSVESHPRRTTWCGRRSLTTKFLWIPTQSYRFGREKSGRMIWLRWVRSGIKFKRDFENDLTNPEANDSYSSFPPWECLFSWNYSIFGCC